MQMQFQQKAQMELQSSGLLHVPLALIQFSVKLLERPHHQVTSYMMIELVLEYHRLVEYLLLFLLG